MCRCRTNNNNHEEIITKKKTNKKGQMGILNFWAGILVFVLIWGIWLGKFIAEWCDNAIITNNITGIDAFLLSYMNLWIFIMLLIVCAFAYFLMGGGQ